MEDKLVQIKLIVRTDDTDEDIKTRVKDLINTLPQLVIIRNIQVS